MAETAVAVAAGTDNQEGVHIAAGEGASPSVPVGGVTTAEEYGLGSQQARRLCMCRGNCNGRVRHEPGACGKRSVSDRPLCSSCKAHKGSSLEKARAPDDFNYYPEGVGTTSDGAENDVGDGQQGPVDGAGPDAGQMEGIVAAQGAFFCLGGHCAFPPPWLGAPAERRPPFPTADTAAVTPGQAQQVAPEAGYGTNRKRSASARDLADAQAVRPPATAGVELRARAPCPHCADPRSPRASPQAL